MSSPVFQSAVLRRETYTNKEVCGPSFNTRVSFGAEVPLIVSSKFDGTARHFYNVNIELDRPVSWICPEDILEGCLNTYDAEELIRRAPGIYLRESLSNISGYNVSGAVMCSLILLHNNRVVAEPSSSNWSKPYHGKMIELHTEKNLIKPKACIVNNDIMSSGYVKKSMGGLPSYIEVSSTDDYVSELTFAQDFIKGDEYRVHVVENSIFVHRLSKYGVDYRRDGLSSVDQTSFPDELSLLLIKMTKKEGLRFSGIDVILNENGFFVIEINPMPGYHSYEIRANSGYPITQALYELLQKPNL